MCQEQCVWEWIIFEILILNGKLSQNAPKLLINKLNKLLINYYKKLLPATTCSCMIFYSVVFRGGVGKLSCRGS